MIKFSNDEAGTLMFWNDNYRDTMFIVVDRPATQDDISAFADEYAAFSAEAGGSDTQTEETQ